MLLQRLRNLDDKRILFFGVLLGVFLVGLLLYPPARKVLAQASVRTNIGTGVHTCAAASPADPIDGILVGPTGLAVRAPAEVILGNFSATPVEIYGNNGVTTFGTGWPICTDPSQCAGPLSLPLNPATTSCAPAASSIPIRVLGVR